MAEFEKADRRDHVETKQIVAQALLQAQGYVSGQQLSERLGITRAAV